jgi:hypothetical protein
MSTSVVKEFSYTKCSPETFTLLPGEYILEVWGASGGTYNAAKALGGAGGYAKGILTLNQETTVFVRVGSQASNTTYGLGSQGCNGGGYGTHSGSRGGGGATDIRLNTDSLYSRVIVAGGGGGASDLTGQIGGHGGGISGGDGKDYPTHAGKGAGQNGETLYCSDGTTSCPKGIFGFGGNSTGSYAGGGGGGWFGGSASYDERGGGGGSGYVLTSSSFKPTSYLLKDSKYYLKDTVLLGGNQSFPAPVGGGNITGRMGDGYARITQLILPLPPVPSLLDFSFHDNELEIKDELRKFNFMIPGNYSSKVRAGIYQFNSTGAACGTSIISEFEFKGSQILNVSVMQNATIYMNGELFLNVPSSQHETNAFVFPGMKIIQKYNASEFNCKSTYYATMSITFIPQNHKTCACNQKFIRYLTLLFITTLVNL